MKGRVSLQLFSRITAGLLYFPTLFIADKLTRWLSPYLEQFWELTFFKWIRVRITCFVAIAMFSAAWVIAIATPLSYYASLKATSYALIAFVLLAFYESGH